MEGQGRAERDPALGRPPASAQRGPRRGRRSPHRRASRRSRQRPQAARPRARLGSGQLDARRRGAVGVPARVRSSSTDFDALIVAFGLVNVLAVIPITPGGLGIIDSGAADRARRLRAAAGDRPARRRDVPPRPVLLPDPARRGPVRHRCASDRGAFERRERLRRLRDIAADASSDERALDFSVRFAPAATRPPMTRRPTVRDRAPSTTGAGRPVATVGSHDHPRATVRSLPRGLRGRRRVQALAGQDDHRVRRPSVLHDHDEPPSAAHQRLVRRARACRAATSSSATSSTRSCSA